MKIVREIENYTAGEVPLYLALGNFDGVHRGHQYLIEQMVNRARTGQGQAGAFVFDPHPGQVINPHRAPRMLVTAERKAELFENLGVELLIYNSFTPAIARWSPEEFVSRILVDYLKVKEVFVGFNYSFGYRGAGTPEYLKQLGEKHNFLVHIIPPFEIKGQVVSSSLIRQAMEDGDIKTAADMLGYYPSWQGKVVDGEKRGSTKIGYPTANLEAGDNLIIPGVGVYAALATVNRQTYKAVVNIGRKPTFHQEYPVTVEAHLIDFNRQIYGELVTLTFVQKIRDEKRFNGLEELVKQISMDRDTAANILSIPS